MGAKKTRMALKEKTGGGAVYRRDTTRKRVEGGVAVGIGGGAKSGRLRARFSQPAMGWRRDVAAS